MNGYWLSYPDGSARVATVVVMMHLWDVLCRKLTFILCRAIATLGGCNRPSVGDYAYCNPVRKSNSAGPA